VDAVRSLRPDLVAVPFIGDSTWAKGELARCGEGPAG
jgi:hypothetical protein